MEEGFFFFFFVASFLGPMGDEAASMLVVTQVSPGFRCMRWYLRVGGGDEGRGRGNERRVDL